MLTEQFMGVFWDTCLCLAQNQEFLSLSVIELR